MELRKETKPMIGTNYHDSDSDKTALYISNSRKRPLSSFKPFDHQHHFSDSSHRPAVEELASKKPCLVVDTSRDCQPLCEALSSNESFSSGLIENECISRQDSSDGMLSRQPPASSGLSAYLEDIDSEEEELDEMVATPSTNAEGSSKPHSKDDLLSMMDRVDREIATIEQRILSLESKQKELTESTKTSSVSSKTEPPVSMATTVFDEGVSDKSIIEVIYSENKQTARNSRGPDSQGLFKGQYPLYYQPSETPFYLRNIKRYRQFRPELLKYLKNRKLSLFKKECSLCEEYDVLNSEWERKVDKWEKSQKKRSREVKNKEMFEKVFPELRSKSEQLRDQAERFNRSGVRAFGVVKSEAELDELAYELFEQEEARGRHRLTHATLPSMVLDDKERRVQFIDTNGVLKDPMVLYREGKSTSLWTDEEKTLFREKFQMFPKNFEKISTFLPNKSVNECVRYYYLAKKNGNFKSLLRRSSAFKRRRHLKSSSNYSLSSPLLIDHAKANKPHPQPATPTNIQSPPSKVEWSQEEVSRLKEGLKMYGRAWGRVYKEVGGNKTATQCKQFYDDYCTDTELNLNSALAEHSARKNAERAEKKMAEIKRVAMTTEPVIPEGVKTHNDEDDDGNVSDNSTTMETVSSQDGGDDDNEEEDSDSETTITDSGQEIDEDTANEDESNSLSTEATPKAKLHPLKLGNASFDNEPIQSPLDIFLSAAEALSNTVPSEVALHDHTYSCPPLDIHGSSGLQLIAAAAAVVSPGLSRGNSWNSKPPPLSQQHHHHAMKAPRGRPPSTQKRSSSTSQRIGPSYLTPTSGSSQNVLLQQDLKPTLRGRSRSAPTEKPRPSLLQKSPAIASPLLLKSGPKVYPTSQPIIRGPNSPLTYSSKSKDSSGNNLISLKAASSGGNTDNITTSNSTNAILQEHKSVGTPINLTSKTATVSGGGNRSSNTGNNNPVLELNLGNMALLLAASGSNQQATLLLPPSSLFNKHTLAVLHGSSLTDSAATLSVENPSSFTIAKHSKPTISIDFSKTDNSIPLVAPLKATQTAGGKPTLTLSLTPSASLSSSRPKPTNSVTAVNTTSNVTSLSSAPSTIPVTMPTSLPVSLVVTSQKPLNVKTTVSSAPVTPAATPSTDDLSNLNLLSNLVAGMTKEQQRVISSTSTVTTSKPHPIVTSSAVSGKPTSNSSTVLNSKPPPVSNNMWKKQQSDLKTDTNNTPSHPVPLSYNSSPQQSLMLYTRSLPLNSANQGASPDEDEDHLEYATRGIDELTRLLGGGANDSNGLSDNSSTSKHPSQWSPDELLCNPFCGNTNAEMQGTPSDKRLSITLASSTSSSISTSSFNCPPLAASVLTTAGPESHSST